MGKIANNLVLDVPPGIGLLGMAAEAEGYCVVNGPDLLWGRDMRGWHPVKGAFEGIIGGPPCTGESKWAHINGNFGESLAPEFMRIVREAQPDWWIMEAVIEHDAPYILKLTPRWLGEQQSRVRYFHSNINLAPFIEVSLFDNPVKEPCVTAREYSKGLREFGKPYKRSRDWEKLCALQGLSPETSFPWFTKEWQGRVLGNGVPLSMGRAVFKAVRKSIGLQLLREING